MYLSAIQDCIIRFKCNILNDKRSVSYTHLDVYKRQFPNSYQGDSRGAEVFSRLGRTTEFTSQGVKLKKTGKAPERLEEDFVDIPDLALSIR